MAEPITPERIQQALEKAGKLDSGYGPLGPSLALYELRELYGEVKSFLAEAWAMRQALEADIRAAEAYKSALESHVAEQEQRAAELASANPPQARALEEHLQAQHTQIRANAEELARQQAALMSNRQHLSEQEDQMKILGQQVLGLQTQVQRRASMGVGG